MKPSRSKKSRTRGLSRPPEFHQRKVPNFLENAAVQMRSAARSLDAGDCHRAVEEMMSAERWASTAWGHAQSADDGDASYDKVNTFTREWAGAKNAIVGSCVREKPARQRGPGVLTRLFRRGK